MNIMKGFDYRSHNIDLIHKMDDTPDQSDYVLHTHIVFQVCLLLSGKCTYHVEGNSYPMLPGDLVVTLPQEVHYIEVDPDHPCERIMLNFGPSLFFMLDPDQQLHKPFISREPGQLNFYRAENFKDLDFVSHFSAMTQNGKDRITIITHMMQLLKSINIAFERSSAADSPMETLESRIIRYINRNLRRDLSLDMLCEKFFVSKAQLYRRFKKATGTTVTKYIETKRMLCARQMILENERIIKVYTECGFQDYSTFYRAYQRYFGHSPRQERHNLN